jgi:hypothetical protein
MNFENDLKIVTYNANAGMGIIFPSKTFIINAPQSIYIISPCDLEMDTIKELNSIDKEIYVIAPNNFHNLHLATVKMAIPKATFFGPKRSAQQSGVELENTKDLIQEDLTTVFIKGNNTISETVFYHMASSTLIITDLLFNMHHKMNLQTKLAMKMAGTFHKLGMSRALKLSIKDKVAFKKSMLSLLDLPFKKVIPSHGNEISREDFTEFIKNF